MASCFTIDGGPFFCCLRARNEEMKISTALTLALFFVLTTVGRLATADSSTAAPMYDAIIKNGLVVDGTGSAPRRLDVGIRADRITYIGNLQKTEAPVVIDANGLAVAPGFVNMLSWAVDDLIADGRSQGDIRQA
jgi:hypothetical protein